MIKLPFDKVLIPVLMALSLSGVLLLLMFNKPESRPAPVIYTQETMAGNVKCIVASLNQNVAISCDWTK